MSLRRRTRRLRRALVKRLPRSWPRRIALVAVVLAASFLFAVNSAVAFFGRTVVFPLSPFHLEAKLSALQTYAKHRPGCLFKGHDDLPQIIERTAARRRVDRLLLAAMIEAESGTLAHRISHTGAMGPAQLMPSTARMLGVVDPFDPEQGIDGGARYLRWLLARYDGNPRLAVAAYNAGPGAVRTEVPRNGETEHYVARVLAQWERLKRARR